MHQVEKIFKQYTGLEPKSIVELPSSGSNRRYFRVTAKVRTYIGTIGTNVEENKAFIALSNHFKSHGLPVPQVLCVSDDQTCYLQEDLGDDQLFKAVEMGRTTGVYSKDERALLQKVMACLPAIQFKGAAGLDFRVCYPQPAFDRRMISFDLNYFKYCFLKASGLEFNEIDLDDDFQKLAATLLQYQTDTFMYRDFQARNVMLVDGNPYFLDFQGGRKGPIYYDVASFVWQAKANYSDELKETLIDTYLAELQPYMPMDGVSFRAALRHFVLFRTLQVLGAYGFRGYFEKKPHFLQSVPFAIDNLRKLLVKPFDAYPYLSSLLQQLTMMPQYADLFTQKRLEVTVYSFAYKKGVPNDLSGNGGGYVFDCRGLENPGKYEHFKKFTGEDPEVIHFIEDNGEAVPFLEHARALMDAHVKRFMDRKFTHLMCCFGCTGGQHRSVYCATKMAQYLAKQYDVKVHLVHRELGTERNY